MANEISSNKCPIVDERVKGDRRYVYDLKLAD